MVATGGGSSPTGGLITAGRAGGASGIVGRTPGGGGSAGFGVRVAFGEMVARSLASDLSRISCGATPSLAAQLNEQYGRSGLGVVRPQMMQVLVVLVMGALLSEIVGR